MEALKVYLKKWEKSFVRDHNRKPNRDDVDNAPNDVKEAYKCYEKLKEEAQNVPVWGVELTKKYIHEKEKSVEDSRKTSIAPLKLISARLRKNCLDKAKVGRNSFSKQTPPALRNNRLSLSTILTDKNEEVTADEKSSQRLHADSEESGRLIAPGGSMARHEVPIFGGKMEFASKFVTPKFRPTCSVVPLKERMFVKDSAVREKLISQIQDEGTSLLYELQRDQSVPVQRPVPMQKLALSNECEFKDSKQNISERLGPLTAKESTALCVDNSVHHEKERIQVQPPECLSSLINIKDDGYEMVAQERQERKEEKGIERTNLKRKKPDSTEVEDEVIDKTCRRSGNLPKTNLNDNFVRINLRVKRFCKRKGSKVTGKSLQRAKWRHKFQNSDKSQDTCFKCGEQGHWSNQCTGKSKIQGDRGSKSSTIKVDDAEFARLNNDDPHNSSGASSQLSGGPSSQLSVGPSFDPMDLMSCVSPCSPCEVSEADMKAALNLFGFNSFRHGQQTAITRTLQGLSSLVVLSTGAGKSLCYQLPAYLYGTRYRATALVVSPLLSLMEDQVASFPACLKGACIHSGMPQDRQRQLWDQAEAGSFHVLLISPEALMSSRFKLKDISFVCIDEAHCISEWSHHFRPAYLQICKMLSSRFGVRCFLGLTATATQRTISSMMEHLGIVDVDEAVISSCPVPSNLKLSVSRDEDKTEGLLNLLQGVRFRACLSIIIYCTRREMTERLASLIRTTLQDVEAPPAVKKPKSKKKRDLWWDAECYHAGLTAAKRRSVQNAFMSGRLRVVVATVAFGMGLDKSDVQGVVHYNLPRGFESYVQEVGRAGRDGQPASCHLFLDVQDGDLCELRRHIFADCIDPSAIKKLVQLVFLKCRCSQRKATCFGHERTFPISDLVNLLDLKEEGIHTLLCYLELHGALTLRPPVYANCSLSFYGGATELLATAKKCLAVAAVVAIEKAAGVQSHASCRRLDFQLAAVAEEMNWPVKAIRSELSALQWDSANGKAFKTGILVEFSGLAFHAIVKTDQTDDDLDDLVSLLISKAQGRERRELQQLNFFSQTLTRVSHKDHYMCIDAVDEVRSDKLKKAISTYFSDGPPSDVETKEVDNEPGRLDSVRHCVAAFIGTYQDEHQLTARSVARVLHGIPSPRFPAEVWGKVRRFWRSHIDVDFRKVLQIAREEMVALR